MVHCIPGYSAHFLESCMYNNNNVIPFTEDFDSLAGILEDVDSFPKQGLEDSGNNRLINAILSSPKLILPLFINKRYCIAGNFRGVQNFAFFEGRVVNAKIKTRINSHASVFHM